MMNILKKGSGIGDRERDFHFLIVGIIPRENFIHSQK